MPDGLKSASCLSSLADAADAGNFIPAGSSEFSHARRLVGLLCLESVETGELLRSAITGGAATPASETAFGGRGSELEGRSTNRPATPANTSRTRAGLPALLGARRGGLTPERCFGLPPSASRVPLGAFGFALA